MAVTRRRLVDNLVGSLKNGCTALATQLVADAFQTLPTDMSTSNALPMVVADDSQGLFEVVLVTGHSAGTNSVTVIRGAQGTTPLQWNPGAIVRVSTTSRDLTHSMTAAAATALTDTFIGETFADENGILRVQTANQGFQALARVMPGGVGAGAVSGFTPGATRELLAQTLTVRGNTSSQGYINGTLPAGSFPNGLVAVIATPVVSNTETPYFAHFFSAYNGSTQNNVGPSVQFRCFNQDGTARASLAVVFGVLALGV